MNIPKEALGKLKCARYNLPLSVGPVTINADNSFVCGRCFNEGALVVTIYETLAQAQETVFPCRYKPFGCQDNLKWGSVKEHEDNCPKQPFSCPATIPCAWRGTVMEIATHFEETHHDDYITETNIVEIRLDEVQRYRKIVITKCGDYIFSFLFNKTNLMLNLKELIDFKTLEKDQYKLKFYAPVEAAVNTEKCLRLGPINIEPYCTFNSSAFEDNIVHVDVGVLNYLNNAGSSIFCEIITVHEKKSNIIKDLALLLECPVCKELMYGIIYQCQTGHSFCNRCIMHFRFHRNKKCPLCNLVCINIRNYALEALVNKFSMISGNIS